MDKYYIPQSLDEPFRLYVLTIDELIILVLPIFFLGLVMQQMVLGFFLGIGGLMLIKKLKGEKGPYFILQLAYWYLPEIIKFKCTPPSYIRLWIG